MSDINTAPLGETPNWSKLKDEVARKIDYIAAAWGKLDAPPEWREKIRRELLMPNLLLLAEFCAAIEENEDADAIVCACGAKWETACSSCEEFTCAACKCSCDRDKPDPDAYAAKLEADEAARLDDEQSSGPCDCGCGGNGGARCSDGGA